MTIENSSYIPPHTSKRIDAIRGLAALGVIYGHSVYGFGTLPVELNGAFWVWIFLPISGFLVGRNFLPGGYECNVSGYARFLVNRFLRIVPLAYVALSIGLASLVARGQPFPGSVLSQFLFVPPLNRMSLSGPLWTVATELQFYFFSIILIPLVFYVVRRGSTSAGLLLFVLAFFGGQLWVSYIGDNASQPRTLFGNISLFIFGMLLACQKEFKINVNASRSVMYIVVCIVVAWFLQNYCGVCFWGGGGRYGIPLGGGAVIALAIVALTVSPTSSPSSQAINPSKMLISKPFYGLAWCGQYTYGIYVWHAIIAVLMHDFFPVTPGVTRLGLLLLAVPLAPISYRWIERPFLSKKLSRS